MIPDLPYSISYYRTPPQVRLTAQTIYISPTMEDAKAALLEQLYEWHGVVTGQARISSTRFQVWEGVCALDALG